MKGQLMPSLCLGTPSVNDWTSPMNKIQTSHLFTASLCRGVASSKYPFSLTSRGCVGDDPHRRGPSQEHNGISEAESGRKPCISPDQVHPTLGCQKHESLSLGAQLMEFHSMS